MEGRGGESWPGGWIWRRSAVRFSVPPWQARARKVPQAGRCPRPARAPSLQRAAALTRAYRTNAVRKSARSSDSSPLTHPSKLHRHTRSSLRLGVFARDIHATQGQGIARQNLTESLWDTQGAEFKSGSRTKPQRRKGKAKVMEGTLSVDNLADLRTTSVS